MNKIKLSEITINVRGTDRNLSYVLEPEDRITTFKDAINYLELIKDDFEEEPEIPF